jgi:hypothetical protein
MRTEVHSLLGKKVKILVLQEMKSHKWNTLLPDKEPCGTDSIAGWVGPTACLDYTD